MLLAAPWSEQPDAVQVLPIPLFQHARTLTDQQEAHTEEAHQQPDSERVTLSLTSSWSCQTVARMALDVMSISITRHPAQVALHVGEEFLQALTWMLLHGGFSLQSSALQHAAALLKALPAQRLPFQSLVDGAVASLSAWAGSPQLDPALHQQWSAAIISCMHKLLDAARCTHQVQAVAPQLATALTAAISAVSCPMLLQTQLCSVLAALAKLWPPALACLPALVPLASGNQSLGLQLVRCLALLAEDTAAAGSLDAAVRQGLGSQGSITTSPQVICMHISQSCHRLFFCRGPGCVAARHELVEQMCLNAPVELALLVQSLNNPFSLLDA